MGKWELWTDEIKDAPPIPKVNHVALSSAELYEFLVKLRNITWETNYVIVSQNALGMMGRRKQPSVSTPVAHH